MFSEVYRPKAANAKHRHDPVFAEQNKFFYAGPLLSCRSRFASHAYVYNMKDVVKQGLFKYLCIFHKIVREMERNN